MFSATFDNLQQQVYSGPGHRWPGAEAYSDGKAWIDPPLWAPTFPLPPPAMEVCLAHFNGVFNPFITQSLPPEV